MAYHNITSDQVYPNGHTLVAKTAIIGGLQSDRGRDGLFKKIIITNHHATDKNTIQLFLDDGAGSPTRYTIANTVIPPGVSLVLKDGITFNPDEYSLKLSTNDNGGATSICVIFK